MTKIHDTLAERFGTALAAARAARSMGQREFAKLIGVSHGLVSLYESGKRTPSLYMVERVAKKLSLKATDLLKEKR